MVRMSDLPASSQASLRNLDCPDMGATPWTDVLPASALNVALVSSAGLMARGGDNIAGNAADYVSLPDDVADTALLINHISVNFDRSGFAHDVNVVMPRERLRELVDRGDIGAVAETHYSFMGATDPRAMVPHVDRLAAQLLADGVNAVCLLPV